MCTLSILTIFSLIKHSKDGGIQINSSASGKEKNLNEFTLKDKFIKKKLFPFYGFLVKR
jgi:hypothetical protein